MNLLWLQSGGCGGCTMSLLCSGARDVLGLLGSAGITLAWHPSLSEASGDEVRALLAEFESGARPLDLLCVEGSLLTGPNGSGRFHMLAGTGRPMIDWVKRLAARARYTLGVGTCAAYGGITAAGGAWNASIVSEIVTYGHTTLTANGLGTYIANATAVGDTGKTIIGVAVMSVFVVGVNRLFWRPLQAYAERRFSVA